MNWFSLAILAAISWALVNNLDKIVVTRFVRSPLGIVVIEGIIGFVVALFFVGELFLNAIPPQIILFCILVGFLLCLFNYLYYKALAISDPTIVAIFMQTVPLFTFLWGILFFSESFSIQVYIGSILIISGGILATLKKGNSNNKHGRNCHIRTALLIMLPASLLLSVNYALQKYALAFVDDKSVFVLARTGGLLFSLCFLLVPMVRKSIEEYFSARKIREWGFFILIEILNLAGIYLVTVAYSVGSISLVTTVTSTQPIFVAILGVIIGTLIFHRPDAISDGLGGFRMPAIFLITAGVYLLSR